MKFKASDYFTTEEIEKIKYIKKVFGWQELILFDENNKIIFREVNNE